MNEMISQLLRLPQGFYTQGLGSLKRSAGHLLRLPHFEHAGRGQQLAGLVRRHGGITREDALRAVGSFSMPASTAISATDAEQPEPAPTQATRRSSTPKPSTHAAKPDLSGV